MGHPFSKFISVKSGLSEGFFEKCGKQEKYHNCNGKLHQTENLLFIDSRIMDTASINHLAQGILLSFVALS
jgi:hypothetical protein